MPTTSFIFPTLVGSASSSQSRCNVTSSSSSSLSSLCSSGARRAGYQASEANDYGFIEYRRSATMDNTYTKVSPSRSRVSSTASKYNINHEDYASPIRNVIRKSASLLSANWWANRILQHSKSPYYSNKHDPKSAAPTMTRRWRSVGTLLRPAHTEETRQAAPAVVTYHRPRASTLVQHNRRNIEENVGHRRTMSLLNNNIENKKPQEFYLLDDFLRHPTPPREEISTPQRHQVAKPAQYHSSVSSRSNNINSISKRSYSLDTSKYRYPDTRTAVKLRSNVEARRNTSAARPGNTTNVPTMGSSPEPPPVPPPPPSNLLSDLYRRSISDRSCSCRSCDVRLIHDSYASLLNSHTTTVMLHLFYLVMVSACFSICFPTTSHAL